MIDEIELGNLYAVKTKSLNPKKYEDETFELYSIKAFDRGVPEILSGNEIGSSKKILQTNDVILSRIIPHIRRCWVVPKNNGLQQIGSGEWIVFRNERAYPDYLRYFLLSNPFHSMFMNTVKGVGGSLLRADPKQVARFKIPLPPLKTQQRIASILDDAAALSDKSAQLLTEYDLLAQSIFLEMFGDPSINPNGWDIKPFDYFAEFDTNMTSDFEKYKDLPHIGISSIERDSGRLVNYKLVKEESLSSGKYLFDERHIIYSKIRPNLNKVALPNFKGLSSADSYPILVRSAHSNRYFFSFLLRSKSFIDFILNHSVRTSIPKANKSQISKYKGIAPPIELQNQFADKIGLIEQQKALAKQELQESEDLFNCLLQKAFKGELV